MSTPVASASVAAVPAATAAPLPGDLSASDAVRLVALFLPRSPRVPTLPDIAVPRDIAKLNLPADDAAILEDARKDLGPALMRRIRYRAMAPLTRAYV